MSERLQLESDLRAVNQIMLSPAWEVITRRLGYGIDTYLDMLLVPALDPLKNEAIKSRIVVYKELLDLPKLILEQVKQNAPANVGEGEPTTEA